LQAKKTPKSEYSPILKKAIEETGVGHLLHRFPAQISGGERQRVALARALVSEAELILLDEPLSAVDVERRDDLIYLLKKVNLAGKTIVHITHNVDETYRLASHVVILNNGLLLQHGDIETVTLKPQSPFVARLFGYLNFFSSDDLNTVVFLQSLGINSSKGEPLVIDPTRIKLALQNNNDLHSRSIEITEIIKTTNGFYVKLSTNPVLTAFIDNATFSANPFYLGNKVTICIR
jgi:ABC-type sulfate/molybdate transport systems ATPase subunit